MALMACLIVVANGPPLATTTRTPPTTFPCQAAHLSNGALTHNYR
ncbi:hypothetical protein AB0C33_15100 [Nonomuraea sp. NPDC048881]